MTGDDQMAALSEPKLSFGVSLALGHFVFSHVAHAIIVYIVEHVYDANRKTTGVTLGP